MARLCGKSIRHCVWATAVLICLGCPNSPSNYTLAVYMTGNGSVELDPPGGVYEAGSVVTATAIPEEPWHFDHWEGDASGSGNPATVTMNGNKSVTAVFTAASRWYELKTSTFGNGGVTLNPPGGLYAAGATITLTAEPGDDDWTFSHWLGGLTGTANPATLTLNSITEVTAVFKDADGLVMQLGYGQLIRMAATPDGDKVVTGSLDGVVRFWDTESGRVENSIFEHVPNPVTALSFSADGSHLLTGHGSGGAEVWEVAEFTTKTPAKWRSMRIIGFDHEVIRAAAFSPNGRKGFLGCEDGDLAEVNLETGDVTVDYAPAASGITCVAYSADGARLAATSYDHTARVFLANVPIPLQSFSHPAAVNAVAFLPGAEEVITGCADGNVRICDIATGAMSVLAGHTDDVLSLALSADGTKAVSGSMDKSAILWDVVAGAPIYTLGGFQFAIPAVCFAAGGDQFFTADRETINLWDTAAGTAITTLRGHTRIVNSAEFSPDGTRAVTGGDYVARLYDAATGELLQSFRGHLNTIKSVSFSPDGARIATGSFDETVRIWDTATGDQLLAIEAGVPVHAVDFSPDGGLVLAGLRDNTARSYDAATGTPAVTFSGHTDRVTAVAFSHDGALVATGSNDNTAVLWNAAAGTPLHVFTFGNYVKAVAFSHDASRLLAGSYGGAFRIYNTVDGGLVWGLPPTPFLAINDLAFSPDASIVLTANTVYGHLWDADGLARLDRNVGFFHAGEVLTCDFAPSGLSVLTGGGDGSTRIWK